MRNKCSKFLKQSLNKIVKCKKYFFKVLSSRRWRLSWGRLKPKTKNQNSQFLEYCCFWIFVLGSSLSQLPSFPTTMTYWRCLEGVWQDGLWTSWKCLENVFTMSCRCMTKANIFILIKTSSEDEDIVKTPSSR